MTSRPAGVLAGRAVDRGPAAGAEPVALPPVRRPSLDGLRAVAVLLVVLAHFLGGLGPGGSSALPGGVLGVDVFFVLSGYLITGLLLAARGRRLRALGDFWFRRARRLLPPLLVVCLVTTTIVAAAAPPPARHAFRAEVGWALGFAMNWHMLAPGFPWSARLHLLLAHTWSLSVEEQFYLAWPLVIAVGGGLGVALTRRRRRALLAACVAGIAASAAWTAAIQGPGDPSQAYFSTWARAGELLTGAALALVAPRVLRWAGRGRRATGTGAAGVVVAVLGVGLHGLREGAYDRGGRLVVCLAVVAVLVSVEAAPAAPLAAALSWRPAALLGRVSYGVYLWQQPAALLLLLPAGAAATLAVEVLRVALTLGLAAASYRWLERPLAAGTLPLVGPSRRRQLAALAVGVAGTVAACLALTA